MRRADASHPAMTDGNDELLPTFPELASPLNAIDLTGRSALVAAVSGGSDSMALLFLVRAWLRRSAPDVRLIAVTIDHGLRQNSAAEAQAVADICSRHGVEHRTLRWEGAKPATGIAAAARDARYRLLGEAARAAGTDIVLTGHTLDDQMETVAMRGARGDGRGLAGMAPATLYDGAVWIMRPMLQTRRDALRDYLAGIGVSWIEDPTNTDIRFERPRVRQALGQVATLPVERAQVERAELGRRAAALLAAHALQASPGLFFLSREFAEEADGDAALYALRILLAAAGGTEHLPDRQRAEALLDRLRKGPARATLSRCAIERRPEGIFLRRELRGLPPIAPVENGHVWDGRFRIEKAPGSADLLVGPFSDGAGEVMAGSDGTVPKGLASASLAAQPAFWRDGSPLACAPPNARAVPLMAPWARFLPSFDLAPAGALAELLGCGPPRPPPLAGHNEG